MIDLQNIFLLDEEFERLNSYYQEHNRHEIRQRAHMIILRTKSYTPSYIADILNRGDYYVIVYVKAWYYFKEDGLFDDDFEGLIEKIEKLEKPIPSPIKTKFDWKKFWNKIFKFFEILIEIFFLPIKVMLGLVTWIFSILAGINYLQRFQTTDNLNDDNISNISQIRGDNNINIQINTGNTNATEILQSENLAEFIDDLKKIRDRENEFVSADKSYAWFIAAMRKFKNYPKIQKIILIGFALYIYYNSAIKGGLVFLYLLGSTIIFNLHSKEQTPISPVFPKQDSTIVQVLLPIPIKQTTDESEYFDSFSPSDECKFLADVPRINSQEVLNDTTNHKLKKYYIGSKDEKVYLQVAAYLNVAQAAFQRRNLIKHGYSESQLISIEENGTSLYGVTIGVAKQNDISKLSELQKYWNKYCKTERVMAMIKTNE